MRFPNLSLFSSSSKKTDDDSDLSYASFSARTTALVLDMLLILLILTPVFEYISQFLNPDFYANGGLTQAQATFEAAALHKISVADAMERLGQLGFFDKMASDYLVQIIVSACLIIFAWVKYDTTPGMFVLRMYIADANTGEKPTLIQYVIRYFVGIIAIVPLTLGLFVMFFNQRKMALHDYAAQTVVLKRKFRFRKKKPEDAAEDEDPKDKELGE
ncbi:MAG: RDD family protein [Rickettsiales bacterium]|nr:RDD family protein [Rickettsiales bacterium]